MKVLFAASEAAPLVKTGGLADSVKLFNDSTGEGTGFVFEDYDANGLSGALRYALSVYRRPKLWRRLVSNAMGEDFSWDRQSGRYIDVYNWLVRRS